MFVPALSICSPSVLHWISKQFIDSIHIMFLLYLLLWFWDFTIKSLRDFIKIYRALIKDIFLTATCRPTTASTGEARLEWKPGREDD